MRKCVLVITCDAQPPYEPQCTARWEGDGGGGGRGRDKRQRRAARAAGWWVSADGDFCPEHTY